MDSLRDYARQSGIPLTDTMLSQFAAYEKLLLTWNEKVNLTAITGHEDVVIKHFLDCLLLLQLDRIPSGAALIDIGSGAGFPGIPLKIARPDIILTLLDSLNKRIQFLKVVSEAIGQQDNCCVHARAEDLGRLEAHREQYDVACARAVAAVPALVEYCLPFVRVGGFFLAMKGGEPDKELQPAAGVVRLLGGVVEETRLLRLPNNHQRSVIVIKKISHTPTEYPRKRQKITKFPL